MLNRNYFEKEMLLNEVKEFIECRYMPDDVMFPEELAREVFLYEMPFMSSFEASTQLDGYGYGKALEVVAEYEARNGGEVHTTVDPVAIANALTYILGERVINEVTGGEEIESQYLLEKIELCKMDLEKPQHFTEEEALEIAMQYIDDNYSGMEVFKKIEDIYDLHDAIFNQAYYMIYDYEAMEALEEYGVFEAIDRVQEYEKFAFGQVYTEVKPVPIANMLWYIVGEELLNDIYEDTMSIGDLYMALSLRLNSLREL